MIQIRSESDVCSPDRKQPDISDQEVCISQKKIIILKTRACREVAFFQPILIRVSSDSL